MLIIMFITVKSNGGWFDYTIEQRQPYNQRRNVSKLYKLRICALIRNYKSEVSREWNSHEIIFGIMNGNFKFILHL